MDRYQGQCLCGSCRYVIMGKAPSAMYLCHCSRCRKETGSMYGANVFFNDVQLVWEKGGKNISAFHLKNTRKQRAFCMTCGSPLPWQANNLVVLPAGTVDDDISLKPTAHIFCASRASWEENVDGLKRFDELPEKQ